MSTNCARAETEWHQSSTSAYSLVCTYPTGGIVYNCNLTADRETAALLMAGIVAKLNATVPAAPFTGAVDATTGRYTLTSTALNFDIDVLPDLAEFVGWPESSVNVAAVVGSDYPPSQFRSLAPLPEPDPLFRLQAAAAESDGGRVDGRLIALVPVLRIALAWSEGDTGHDWAAAEAWLRYALRGARFTVFRHPTTSTRYARIWSAPGAALYVGTSLCVLTPDSRQLAREFLDSRYETDGWLRLEAQALEGF